MSRFRPSRRQTLAATLAAACAAFVAAPLVVPARAQDPAVVDLVTRRWKEYGLKGLTGRHLNSGSVQRG